VFPFKNFFASCMLSIYLSLDMYWVQGALHRLISYNRQGLVLLLKIESEQLRNKNAFCKDINVESATEGDTNGPK
ncbi:uncharacterized protein METZ01_LOCUS287309, partial [marine metagenome]